jgi:hypothetical protein
MKKYIAFVALAIALLAFAGCKPKQVQWEYAYLTIRTPTDKFKCEWRVLGGVMVEARLEDLRGKMREAGVTNKEDTFLGAVGLEGWEMISERHTFDENTRDEMIAQTFKRQKQ